MINHLVAAGYAVAGSANTMFWPLELAFSDYPALLEAAAKTVGSARHTVAVGLSIGGIITAGWVQLFPGRLSGALSMCGNLAGAVATHNRELDMGFVVTTLIAPGTGLRIAHIGNPYDNLQAARQALHDAQQTAAGRARLALAAAVGNIPGWHDPTSAEPARHDYEQRQRGQFAWFEAVSFLVFFWAREQVERQAGGNPSWNTDVDYRHLLATSVDSDEVEALYRAARLNLDEDLDRLDAAERIVADPDAVAYLERNIVLSGALGGVPVLTVHTDGDGLVTPENQRAYADVVSYHGDGDLLRQLFVHRAGHCTFTLSEIFTALDVLLYRIERGDWPDVGHDRLNADARQRPAALSALPSGEPMAAGFFAFEPRPFSRPFDIRDIQHG